MEWHLHGILPCIGEECVQWNKGHIAFKPPRDKTALELIAVLRVCRMLIFVHHDITYKEEEELRRFLHVGSIKQKGTVNVVCGRDRDVFGDALFDLVE